MLEETWKRNLWCDGGHDGAERDAYRAASLLVGVSRRVVY